MFHLLAPRPYGWEHIVYLILTLALGVGSIVLIKLKVKSEKTLDIVVKSLGGVLLATIVANRISLIFHFDTPVAIIPNSFCGITSFLFGLWAVIGKRDSLPFHYLVYAAFWGGTVAVIYPTFIGQNEHFMYLPTITGLLHHSMSVYMSVLLVATGYVKLSIKKFYAFPIGFCILMTYGIFLLEIFPDIPDGAMYIHKPLVPGTFVTWYWVGPALVLGSLGLLALWEKIVYPKYFAKKGLPPAENQEQQPEQITA